MKEYKIREKLEKRVNEICDTVEEREKSLFKYSY